MPSDGAVRRADRRRSRSRCPAGRSATCARRPPTSRRARGRRRGARAARSTAAHRPNAPSTCSQAPCALAGGRDLDERVAGAGVDVAGLRAHDRRARRRRRARERARPARIRPCPSTGDAPRRLRPEPEHAQRGQDRGVRLVADHDRDRSARPAARAPRRPSPTRSSTAWRATARHVVFAIWPPVTKPDAGLARQPEQLEQPAADDLLDDGRGRGQDVQPGVLIPRARQPVGRDRGRQRAADDEAEVARARRSRRSPDRRRARAAR